MLLLYKLLAPPILFGSMGRVVGLLLLPLLPPAAFARRLLLRFFGCLGGRSGMLARNNAHTVWWSTDSTVSLFYSNVLVPRGRYK